VRGELESGADVLITDPDWNRLCFNPGQERLFAYHTALRDAWAEAGITIERLDHLQYLQRYVLSVREKLASVQYHYKGNRKVSKMMATPGAVSDPDLLGKALSLMNRALASPSSGGTELSDPFLLEFQRRLEHALEGTDIRVVSVEPMQYRARVEFEESGQRAQIVFCYNNKKTWTSAQEVGGQGASNGLIERVQQLMEDKA
jgi:hypothetical protein